jgi:hypothetical protein
VNPNLFPDFKQDLIANGERFFQSTEHTKGATLLRPNLIKQPMAVFQQ